MANLELNVEKKQIVFGEDSVIIQKWGGDIKGGRALNVDGITDEVLHAGRVIVTDGKGVYKPLAISSDAYEALPAGYSYAGVLYRSILTKEPAASILTSGQVNEPAAKEANGASVPDAFKTAFPGIQFVSDKNAGVFADTDATA